MRTVALIAGASGSGKSRLAKATGWPILRLDNFYKAETAPDMPRDATGQIDWDDVQAWNNDAAAEAVCDLVRSGVVQVPVYSIAENAISGQQTIDARDAVAFVAEGIFATTILKTCQDKGIPVVAIWLDRGRWMTWWRRLRRDVQEHRKPWRVLWHRGIALRRAEPALRQAALDAGFTPMTMRAATSRLRSVDRPNMPVSAA